jgi:hypothetical protein
MTWFIILIVVLAGYIVADGIRDKRVDDKIKAQEKRIGDLEEKLKFILGEIEKEDFK